MTQSTVSVAEARNLVTKLTAELDQATAQLQAAQANEARDAYKVLSERKLVFARRLATGDRSALRFLLFAGKQSDPVVERVRVDARARLLVPIYPAISSYVASARLQDKTLIEAAFVMVLASFMRKTLAKFAAPVQVEVEEYQQMETREPASEPAV